MHIFKSLLSTKNGPYGYSALYGCHQECGKPLNQMIMDYSKHKVNCTQQFLKNLKYSSHKSFLCARLENVPNTAVVTQPQLRHCRDPMES